MNEGDVNSKFFHSLTFSAKKNNFIPSLSRDDDIVVHEHDRKCDVVTSYFMNLFRAQNNCNDFISIINNIFHCVSAHDNESLLATFTIEEFQTILFQMNSNKSPDSDDLNPTFFKNVWHLYGLEIFHYGTTWLEIGHFPPQVNNITIVLIPKNNNPANMLGFQPIFLCNVLYKIISKVLANRLKPILLKCFSIEQSAFVEDCPRWCCVSL